MYSIVVRYNSEEHNNHLQWCKEHVQEDLWRCGWYNLMNGFDPVDWQFTNLDDYTLFTLTWS